MLRRSFASYSAREEAKVEMGQRIRITKVSKPTEECQKMARHRWQTDTGLKQVSYCCQVQRRLSFLVLHGGIRSMGQKQSAELCPPLLRCLVEWRECPFVGGVDAGVVLDQKGSYVHMLDVIPMEKTEKTDVD